MNYPLVRSFLWVSVLGGLLSLNRAVAQPIYIYPVPYDNTRGVQVHLSGYAMPLIDTGSFYLRESVTNDPATPNEPFFATLTRSEGASREGVSSSGTATATVNSLVSSNRITLFGSASSSAVITTPGGPDWYNARVESYGHAWASLGLYLTEYCRFSLSWDVSASESGPLLSAMTAAQGSASFSRMGGFPFFCGTNLQVTSSEGPSSGSTSFRTNGFLESAMYNIGISCDAGPDLFDHAASGQASVYEYLTFEVVPLGTRIVAMEVIQTVQSLNNSVPLIAGKPTYARVYLEPQSAPSVPMMTPKLRGYNNLGQELPGSPLTPMEGSAKVALPNAADPARRADWGGSLNFRLPSSWATNYIGLKFEMTGLQGGSYMSGASFGQSPKLDLKLMNVRLVSGGVTNQAPSSAGVAAAVAEVASLYPLNPQSIHLSQENMTIKLPAVTPEDVLEKLTAKRIEDNSSAIYVGAVPGPLLSHPGYGTLLGISDNIPGNVVAVLPGQPFVLAHEIAHALGEFHTVNTQFFGQIGLPISQADPVFLPETNYACGPCGMLAPLNRAVMFPFFDPPFARLGPVTNDHNQLVFGLQVNPAGNVKVFNPASSVDLMQTCIGYEDWWISSHTYGRLFQEMWTRWPVSPFKGSKFSTPGVLIRGTVNLSNNTVSLLPIAELSLNASPMGPAGDTHTLRIYQRDGQGGSYMAYSQPFTPTLPKNEGSEVNNGRGYFSIPVACALSDIDHVEVMRDSSVLAQCNRSAHAPVIQLLSPTGGEVLNDAPVLARWNASDLDGGSLAYKVQYSRDGGQTWQTLAMDWPDKEILLDASDLKASTNALLQVIASDGMNCATSRLASAFTIANHAPTVQIISPATNATVVSSAMVVLSALAYDLDDGTLASVIWSSSLDGVLGQGSMLEVSGTALTAGKHTITATVVDSAGATNSATTTIQVARFATAQIQKVSQLADGSVQLSIFGDATGRQVLESSTNLLDWISVSTNTADCGLLEFTCPIDPAKTPAFFRVRTEPYSY